MIVLGAIAACGGQPSGSGKGASSAPQADSPSEPQRTLVAAIRVEPATLALRNLHPSGVALYLSKGMFNAGISYLDDKAEAHAHLVEALPHLDTDSWKVFPDGRMETTYRVRPNATWHDGHELTAEDFVFGWRVYTTPGIAEPNTPPWPAVESVKATDSRTFVIAWSKPYADADTLTVRGREFAPMPRHVLAASYERDSPEAFQAHPYWTREYIQAGPFKLDRWEQGVFIEASAFEGHVLGRPKIDRMKMIFISDANTALANILAGEVHLAADTAIRLEQQATLKREWGPRQLGTILQHQNQWRAAFFQFRSEVPTPKALQDVRVRKALAYAIDKEAINAALYDGDAVFGTSMIPPSSEYAAAAQSTVVRYDFNLQRSEQLMAEAGYAKVGGIYTSPTDGRVTAEVRTNAAADNESELAILASGWRTAGFDMQELIIPAAQAQDPQLRSTFPGAYVFNTNLGDAGLFSESSGASPRLENRWTGTNYGAWSNPEYDRLADQFSQTVDRAERGRQVGRMVQIFSEDVGAITLFMRTQPWAAVAAINGMVIVPSEANMTWNIHEWTFR